MDHLHFVNVSFSLTCTVTSAANCSCQMHNVPICLMYGKEDPWVRPVWGLQVKHQVPNAPYFEISPAGHCPHDETPEVVNFLLRGWIKSLESEGAAPLPLLDSQQCVEHDIIGDFEFSRGTSKKVARVKLYGSKLFSWNRLSSYFKFSFQDR
ncbi:hypothetical protein Leryth_007156 [Lithospermum erythrorhizon]|nr:hypothetical protein Leryth_007156 [Lithospermum erythrorhizon]